jgi:hypothetical protein
MCQAGGRFIAKQKDCYVRQDYYCGVTSVENFTPERHVFHVSVHLFPVQNSFSPEKYKDAMGKGLASQLSLCVLRQASLQK